MNRMKFTGLIIMMLLICYGYYLGSDSLDNECSKYSEMKISIMLLCISLNNAANAIESSRKMNFFNNFILNDPLSFNDTSTDISGIYEHWKLLLLNPEII